MKLGLVALLLCGPVQEEGFADMTAAEVVEWISRHSGRRFSAPADLNLKNRRATINKSSLDPKQAYEVGTRILRSFDLGVIQADPTGLQEVVPAPIACKKPLAVFDRVEAIPKSDEFCTLTLRLQYVSPRDVQAALINLVTYPQNCLSSEASRSLVLSDYASNLRKLAEIVRLMEVPGPSDSFRISVTVLEATKGEAPEIPETFVPLDLPKAAGANRFRSLGELSARFKVGEPRPAVVKAAVASEAVLRFKGPHPIVVDLAGSSRGGTGPVFERFSVSPDREGAAPAPVSLQTRVELKTGPWVLVGVLPTDAAGTSLVVLARALTE